jgi:hypothetical protein
LLYYYPDASYLFSYLLQKSETEKLVEKKRKMQIRDNRIIKDFRIKKENVQVSDYLHLAGVVFFDFGFFSSSVREGSSMSSSSSESEALSLARRFLSCFLVAIVR